MPIRHHIFEPDYITAHKHSSNHRAELERSDLCGCFYCMAIFPPSEITEWIDEGLTAICPKCPVDSVTGSASGYPITKEFLEQMHSHWFLTWQPDLAPVDCNPGMRFAFISCGRGKLHIQFACGDHLRSVQERAEYPGAGTLLRSRGRFRFLNGCLPNGDAQRRTTQSSRRVFGQEASCPLLHPKNGWNPRDQFSQSESTGGKALWQAEDD